MQLSNNEFKWWMKDISTKTSICERDWQSWFVAPFWNVETTRIQSNSRLKDTSRSYRCRQKFFIRTISLRDTKMTMKVDDVWLYFANVVVIALLLCWERKWKWKLRTFFFKFFSICKSLIEVQTLQRMRNFTFVNVKRQIL